MYKIYSADKKETVTQKTGHQEIDAGVTKDEAQRAIETQHKQAKL